MVVGLALWGERHYQSVSIYSFPGSDFSLHRLILVQTVVLHNSTIRDSEQITTLPRTDTSTVPRYMYQILHRFQLYRYRVRTHHTCSELYVYYIQTDSQAAATRVTRPPTSPSVLSLTHRRHHVRSAPQASYSCVCYHDRARQRQGSGPDAEGCGASYIHNTYYCILV